MKRSDRERLRDIGDAIDAVRAHSRQDRPERLKRDAILYNLVIIGEAVKGLDDATRLARPEVPWKEIAGLRDLLTHEYFRIEMSEIDKILERDLSALEAAVAALLRSGAVGPKEQPRSGAGRRGDPQ